MSHVANTIAKCITQALHKSKLTLSMQIFRFPEYVLQHLERMSVNSSQRLHQSCCLLYLSYMMTMYGLTAMDWKKKGKQTNKKWFGACLIMRMFVTKGFIWVLSTRAILFVPDGT